MSYVLEEQFNSPNFRAGRPEGAPNVIVIHHWGADGQSHNGVIRELCAPGVEKSAHYIVSGRRVTCIVDPDDRAWHAGPGGNPRGIGIECRPECDDETFRTVAELIRDIRAVYGHLPLTGHRDYMATECPGRYYARLGELSQLADTIHASAPARPKRPAVGIRVDGYIGTVTVARLQTVLRTPEDGLISDQWSPNAQFYPAIMAAWPCPVRFGNADSGSHVVIALQKALGCPADGVIGCDTIRQWQKRLGVTADGYLGTTTGRAIQTALNRGRAF